MTMKTHSLWKTLWTSTARWGTTGEQAAISVAPYGESAVDVRWRPADRPHPDTNPTAVVPDWRTTIATPGWSVDQRKGATVHSVHRAYDDDDSFFPIRSINTTTSFEQTVPVDDTMPHGATKETARADCPTRQQD